MTTTYVALCLVTKARLRACVGRKILVDNTTASANVARELNGIARKAGVGFIDAPVSGGQAGAEIGALTEMCGFSKTHFIRSSIVMPGK